MNPIKSLRRWWQEWTGEDETPFDGDTPAWVLSLAFHLILLITLGLIWQYRPKEEFSLTLESTETEEQPRIPEEVQFSNDPQTEIGSNSLAGTNVAMAMAPVLDAVSNIQQDVDPTEISTIEVPFMDNISTAPTQSRDLLAKGASGVGMTGTSGAVDRITQEILTSLEQRRTLVVWLFDQSGSMQVQREAIGKRFNRIYEELGILEASGNEVFQKHGDHPLLTAVMAFGQKITFRTAEPTADLAEIKRAVDGIENDPSGMEMVFGAIGSAVKKYQSFRTERPRRNVMVVVVSDEVGDDEARLDECLAVCRRYEMPIYCIGVPAPFGRQNVEVKYVDPDPKFDQSVQWIGVRQGPESMLPEAVQLAFTGTDRSDEYNYLDSGFGPFSLTRLCVETGGIYFAVHPNRTTGERRVTETAVMSARLNHFFDPAIMRNYQPDYVSAKEYNDLVQSNKARLALVMAARNSWIDSMERPRLEFPKVDEGEFKRSLDQGQQVAAKLEPKVRALYDILKQGEVDRPKLTQPRWQAGFDLAMGRTLAVQVRTRVYNAMLAKAKNGLKFENPENDTFVLVPSDEISVGSELEKMGKQARMYLERVCKDHASTPWALLAERELKEPIGWKWTERFTNVQGMRMGDGGGNAAPPQDALNKMKRPPRRENVKL